MMNDEQTYLAKISLSSNHTNSLILTFIIHLHPRYIIYGYNTHVD